MPDRLGFVVVTFNQASGLPGLPMAADLYIDMEDARIALEWERAETAKVGRRERHVIAEVIELEDEDG